MPKVHQKSCIGNAFEKYKSGKVFSDIRFMCFLRLCDMRKLSIGFTALLLLVILLQISCDRATGNSTETQAVEPHDLTVDSARTLRSRFNPPPGCAHVSVEQGSFAEFLTALPLKPTGSQVRTFDGGIKDSSGIYCAVVDLPIGNKDLHQCADAVMHLRAEFLWQQNRYSEIAFDLTNGFRMAYSEWMLGKRLSVQGNTTKWVQKETPSNTHNDLWQYLQVVFTYAGTLSLARELTPIQVEDMRIGDVFVYGGSPGHAVIVVDMAEDTTHHLTYFMLAQSYMPAQEIQILLNPTNPALGPWYPIAFGEVLQTPSWVFDKQALRRF